MSPPGYTKTRKEQTAMRKTFALLFTLALTASCTEQEILAPVAPATPDSDVLIVPGMSIGASGSAEATPWYSPAADTRGMTRAASYPYGAKGTDGALSVLVTADKDGQVAGARFHSAWTKAPAHDELSPYNSLAPRLEVAKTEALVDAVEWVNASSYCTAPWRLPTFEELKLIRTHKSILTGVNTTRGGYYWAATDKAGDSNQACWVDFNSNNVGYRPKTVLECLVRCVRDAYPYVTTNADGKMSVIVSQDERGNSGAALHAPWTVTPAHYENTATNSISYRFEIDQSDKGNAAWGGTNGTCAAPWRRPTLNELRVIYSVKNQITGLDPFAENFYWTASQTGSTICVFKLSDGTFSNDKAYITSWNTRCVRDLSDNFTAAPGSKVATLWGYTNTTGLLADNLVPPTTIKNTTTGFELESAKYFPADGNKKLYFYAHAPNGVGETIANTNNATVTYTLTGQTDVLWAKDDRGIARNSTPAWQEQPFFQFQHKLMRLAFKVVADGSFTLADSPAVTKITAKNVNTKVVLTVPTGATVFSTPAEVSISPTTNNAITTAGTELTDILLVEPKTTITLSVVTGGVTYPDITLTLTGEGAGTAGMGHLITLTFKQNQIVPAAVIIPWGTTGTGSGDLI